MSAALVSGRMRRCRWLVVLGAVFSYLSAADQVKKPNPNKVADFAEIESRIYKNEMLENFDF